MFTLVVSNTMDEGSTGTTGMKTFISYVNAEKQYDDVYLTETIIESFGNEK